MGNLTTGQINHTPKTSKRKGIKPQTEPIRDPFGEKRKSTRESEKGRNGKKKRKKRRRGRLATARELC